VAVVQAEADRGRIERNLERAGRFIAEGSRRGASLVVFPEMYLTGYEVRRRLIALSVSPHSPVLRAVAEEARRYRTAVLMGYPEQSREGVYNAVTLVTADGSILPAYRKIHLFGWERRHFRPGARHRLFRVSGLRVGLLICYDLEFPEPARVLAMAGADLIAVSSANMEPYRAAQEVYVRARALENQVFVALANRVGIEDRCRFVGGSGIWDPSGATLVHADRGERILVATIDRRRVSATRRRFSYLAERRPEAYRGLLDQRGPKRGAPASRRHGGDRSE
jgi:predicted amidohydrolase